MEKSDQFLLYETMELNFKNIHIGNMIQLHVDESQIDVARICKFMELSEEEIKTLYLQKDLPTNLLLRWSKLLQYDFFRIYSQHLILFAPQKRMIHNNKKQTEYKKNSLPEFRKNLYTKEIIDFIIELIRTGKKTKEQVMKEYNIPKTTLYKWLKKY